MSHQINASAVALAGPGNRSPSSVTSSSPLTPVSMPPRLSEGKYPGHIGLGLPFTGGIKQRKMRVTAPEVVGGYMPGRKDKSVTSTIEEVDEATDTADYDGSNSTSDSDAVRGEEASPPLLSPRRSRGPRFSPSDSLSAIISEDWDIRTSGASDSSRIPLSPAPLLNGPTGQFGEGTFLGPRHVGLGLDLTNVNIWQREQSTITYQCSRDIVPPKGQYHPRMDLASTSGSGLRGTDCSSKIERGFDPFRSLSPTSEDDREEEVVYHLPSDLLVPELAMTPSKLFANLVRGWTQRRQEAQRLAIPPLRAKL